MTHSHALLTTNELARRLNVRRETVVRWANEGHIPCLRPTPSTLRFEWDAVEAAIKKQGHRPRSRAK